MNINLVYEGKNYNFDIPNSVTIDYLKELSSKIFNSDKTLLDLIYNNEKIQNKNDNTLLRDLIPEGETNTILTVQINKGTNTNANKNEIIPLVSLKNKNNENIEKEKNNNSNIEKNDIIKDKENISNSDKKTINKKIINIIKNNNKSNNSHSNIKSKIIVNKNNNGITKEFDIKIFQNNFIKKNRELLELMKQFGNKIKEVYLSLYKKYINSGGNTNNLSPSNNTSSISSISLGINNNYFYELSIYEKKLLNFQEKQIQYYKTLLELISKYDKNKDFFQLNDFYTNLLINTITIKNSSLNNKEDYTKVNKILKFKKVNNIKLTNNKLFSNNNSLLHNLSSLNLNNDNFLPVLKNKNYNSSINLEKKNINYNLINNISSLNSKKINSKGKNLNNKIDKEKEISQKNNNVNCINTSKKPLSLETKCIINNNILKNNETNNEKEKEKDKEKGKEKDKNSDNNSSINSNNSSDRDLVDTLTINENKKSIIAPIPLKIRNSECTNIMSKKLSVINNSLRSNSIINNINNEGSENIEKIEKKKSKALHFSLINHNSQNFPFLNKKNNINETTLNKSKRKGLNESENNNEYMNMKKIKDIDISSMTINDSNFIRDKQKNNKKKNNKDMNKYDFFM